MIVWIELSVTNINKIMQIGRDTWIGKWQLNWQRYIWIGKCQLNLSFYKMIVKNIFSLQSILPMSKSQYSELYNIDCPGKRI